MILLEVPLYPQETKDTCADACAKMCIGYYLSKGVSAGKSSDVPSEQTLVAEYGQECIAPIVAGLRDYCGICFSYCDKASLSDFRETIENSLRSAHPVVLDVKAGTASLLGYTTRGHYIVVAGVEDSENSLTLIIHDSFHKDGFGIGQTLRLHLDDVYDAVKYMVCEHSGRETGI